jgi:hypothetical protein
MAELFKAPPQNDVMGRSECCKIGRKRCVAQEEIAFQERTNKKNNFINRALLRKYSYFLAPSITLYLLCIQ